MIVFKDRQFLFPRPIPFSKRDQLYEWVFSSIPKQSVLNGLNKDCSWEGGFNFPFTASWRHWAIDPNNCLDYHDSRQLRFIVDDTKLIGLRYKDGVCSWSVEEVDRLKSLINAFALGRC